MARELRTAGRFSLHEKPNAFPYMDIVNGTPEGPVFDLGVDLEMRDGVVYIKAEHIEEMAEQLGMLSSVEADALIEENKALKAMVDTIPDKVGRFTDGINALVRDYHDDILDVDSGDDLSDDEESTGEAKRESSTNGDNASSKSQSVNGQIFGFDLFQGPNDLSTGTSNGSKSGKTGTKG